MSSPELTAHRTGTVRRGDIELFYRRFGAPCGASPILILHGAGYYDSADWVQVATALAGDRREVVVFDARGYGRSGWSPAADYSLDAQLADITAMLDHLSWEQPVLFGHSRGGSFALRFVSAHPERVGAVIFADSFPGRTARGGPKRGVPRQLHRDRFRSRPGERGSGRVGRRDRSILQLTRLEPEPLELFTQSVAPVQGLGTREPRQHA